MYTVKISTSEMKALNSVHKNDTVNWKVITDLM